MSKSINVLEAIEKASQMDIQYIQAYSLSPIEIKKAVEFGWMEENLSYEYYTLTDSGFRQFCISGASRDCIIFEDKRY